MNIQIKKYYEADGGYTLTGTKKNPILEMRQAITALHLELPASIIKDISEKFETVVTELSTEGERKAVVNAPIQDISEAIGKIDAALKSREVKAVGEAEIEEVILRHYHGFTREQWAELKDEFPYCEIPAIVKDAIAGYKAALQNKGDEYLAKLAGDLGIENHQLKRELATWQDMFHKLERETNLAALQSEVIPANFKEVTGFDTPKEMSAYNKGREDEEAVFMKFISEWDGHTKSYFGKVMKNTFDRLAALQPEAEGTTYSEWQLCPKCNGQGTYRTIGEYASTTAFIQCDVCFGAKVLAKNVSEQIVAYVHEIDSLRETNRKLGEKIAELQPEAVSASQLKQKQ